MPGEQHPVIATTRLPVVDRERELAQLVRCADRARSGSPVTVRVVGEAGMGKTVLVRRFVRTVGDFHVAHAVCEGPALAGRPGDVAGQLVSALARRLAVEGQRLVEVVGEALRSRPVLLIVDGVQWADPSSVAELAALRRELGTCGLATVTVERRSPAAGPASGTEDVVVPLGPFTVPQVHELAARARTGALVAVAAEEAYLRAGGHPMYTASLLTEVAPEVLADHAAVIAPPTLVRLLRSRVDALPADSRRLLQALAALGERAPRTVVPRVAGVADEARVWAPLETAGMVRTRGNGLIGWRYRVERDAVYETMPLARRRALHAAAVEVVGPETALAHRVAAANGPDPDLAAELDTAGQRAVRERDPGRAAEYHLWAAGLTIDPEDRERRLLSAVEHFLLDVDRRRVRTLRASVEASTASAQRSLVLAMLTAAPAMREHHLRNGLAATDEEGVAARLTAALAAVRLAQGRRGDAAALAERALATGRLHHPWCDLTWHLLIRAHLNEYGLRGAEEQLTRWSSAQAMGGAPVEPVLAGSGAVWLEAGRLSRAVADLRRALAVPSGAVGTAARLECGALLAHAEYLSGEWEAAEGTVTRVLKEALARDAVEVLVRCRAAAAQLAAGRGHWAEADEHLRAAADTARLRESRSDADLVAAATAVVAQARGDRDRMLAALTTVWDSGSQEQHWYRQLLHTEALIGTRRLTEAARELARLRLAAADTPALHVPVSWLSGWLAMESGDRPGARARFEDGLAAADSGDVPVLVLGRLEQSLARIEHRARRSRRAVELVLRAQDRFAALRAVPFLERCAADLAGYQPKVEGREAAADRRSAPLTERESAVVELVARGLTNNETATQLRITPKTVEYHLGNVYAKLGLTSRRELRRRWARDDT